MTVEAVLKIIMAAAGVIGGLASTAINAKTLVDMANQAKTKIDTSNTNTESQSEEV